MTMVGTKRGREGTGWSWPAGEVARLGADFPGILFASPDGTTLEGFLGMGRGRGNSQTNAKGSSLPRPPPRPALRPAPPRPRPFGSRGGTARRQGARPSQRTPASLRVVLRGEGRGVRRFGGRPRRRGRADLARARLEESGGPHAFLLELRSVVDRAAFAAPTRTTSGLGLDLGSHLRLCAECRSWLVLPCRGRGRGGDCGGGPLPPPPFWPRPTRSRSRRGTAAACRTRRRSGCPPRTRAAPLLLHALPCEVGVREAEEPGDQGAGDSAARWVVGTLGAFDEAVGSLGGFFLAMAALDSACAVLEPELKRGEDVAHRFNYRRISLGGRCACVVTFRDPHQAWPFTSETLEVVLVGPRAACEAMEASRAAFWRARARAEGGPQTWWRCCARCWEGGSRAGGGARWGGRQWAGGGGRVRVCYSGRWVRGMRRGAPAAGAASTVSVWRSGSGQTPAPGGPSTPCSAGARTAGRPQGEGVIQERGIFPQRIR